MGAIFSPCGNYRYVLTRKIPCVLRWIQPMLFIMLNPSTANAETDDPTIRRCLGFAKREGATDLTVVNLFAMRATNPRALVTYDDPIGPLNDKYIAAQITTHAQVGTIIVAWGNHPLATKRAQDLLRYVVPMGTAFMCLGITKSGAPRHPLYLKNSAPVVPWRPQ